MHNECQKTFTQPGTPQKSDCCGIIPFHHHRKRLHHHRYLPYDIVREVW